MKVLFLDLDGVLNRWDPSDTTPITAKDVADMCTGRCLDRTLVDTMNQFLAETGVKVVISSSWRNQQAYAADLDALRHTLRYEGGLLADILSATKYLGTGRENEILEWLSRHPEVTNYVALDDDCFDMLKLGPHFVQTDSARGFTEEDAKAARAALDLPRS